MPSAPRYIHRSKEDWGPPRGGGIRGVSWLWYPRFEGARIHPCSRATLKRSSRHDWWPQLRASCAALPRQTLCMRVHKCVFDEVVLRVVSKMYHSCRGSCAEALGGCRLHRAAESSQRVPWWLASSSCGCPRPRRPEFARARLCELACCFMPYGSISLISLHLELVRHSVSQPASALHVLECSVSMRCKSSTCTISPGLYTFAYPRLVGRGRSKVGPCGAKAVSG